MALGWKIEEELDLPEISRFNAKHTAKAGLAKARIKLQGGRKEKAIGWNAEYQMTGGRRENVQACFVMTLAT